MPAIIPSTQQIKAPNAAIVQQAPPKALPAPKAPVATQPSKRSFILPG